MPVVGKRGARRAGKRAGGPLLRLTQGEHKAVLAGIEGFGGGDLTAEDVAVLFGCTRRAVNKWATSRQLRGRLRKRRPPSRSPQWVFSPDAVREFAEGRLKSG